MRLYAWAAATATITIAKVQRCVRLCVYMYYRRAKGARRMTTMMSPCARVTDANSREDIKSGRARERVREKRKKGAIVFFLFLYTNFLL